MKPEYIYWLIIILVSAGTAFLVSGNLFLALGIVLIYGLVLFFFLTPIVEAYRTKNRKRHECYRFINSFLIALSATSSYPRAIEAASNGSKGELKEILDSISHMSPLESIDYLKAYFNDDLYRMFLSVIDLHQEQGGEVLSLSGDLLNEATRVEEFGQGKMKEAKKNLFQMVLLWGMSLLLMSFIRVGLARFFDSIGHSWSFLGSVILFYAFFLGSIVAYACFLTEEKPVLFKKKKKEANP